MDVKKQKVTEDFALYCGDCCKVLPELKDESIGFSVFSPPFVSLYSYSDESADMGNSTSREEFFEHYDFVADQLMRLMMPGRIVAIHCMDLPTHKRDGDPIGVWDFPGEIIRCMERHGFIHHCSRITIWKDPLLAAVRTKSIQLAHKQIVKDSAMVATGIPDCIVAFRKPGENLVPIEHQDGFYEYHGSRSIPHELLRFRNHKDPKTNKLSHWIWQQYASPVWFDIRQTRVLKYREAKEEDDQRHICLARGSLVLTKERGYVPIQEVVVNEQVLTHKGRWRNVLAVQLTGNQQVVSLCAQGVPGLTLTSNHKLWMRKSSWVRERDGAERIDPEWVKASNSLRGYVNLKLPKEESTNILDLDVWWIVGRWLADGHWDARKGAHISCGYHEIDGLLTKLGKYAGFQHNTGTAMQIRLSDPKVLLRGILRQCGHGASGKHIPPEAYTLPFHQARALLHGYMSGDGPHLKDRDRWTASSVSKSLLLGMAMLVQRVYGAIASVYKGRPEHEAIIQGRKVSCKQDWILGFEVPGDRYKEPFILEDGAWKKVRSITDEGSVETWNLKVEEDGSFTAEGCIVKNCPLQLDTIERCIALWSAKGDTVLTPFMGVGSEAYIAVKNGRKAIGIELKRSYFRQAVRNLKSIEPIKKDEGFGL